MSKITKEIILAILSLAPYTYLAFVWSELPDSVPTHFDMEGNANGWSEKMTLLFMPTSFALLLNILLYFLPNFDPKNKLNEMGDRYYTFRFILVVFVSILMTYILYVASKNGQSSPNIVFILIGFLFMVLGNYFQAVRPNYFIGIRSPWTLESESVWKKTHRTAGRLYILGGLAILVAALTLSPNILSPVLIGIITLLVFVPFGHSYLIFKKEKASQQVD